MLLQVALLHSFLWLSNILFPGGSVVKNLPAMAGDTGLIPGLGRSPGEGNGNPLQYSCLENPMGRGAWRATVHRVAKSRTWLSDQSSAVPVWYSVVYMHHFLFMRSCPWMFRLPPCPGCCNRCFSEHWAACVFSNHGFLQTYAQESDCRIIWEFYFLFFWGSSILSATEAEPLQVATNMTDVHHDPNRHPFQAPHVPSLGLSSFLCPLIPSTPTLTGRYYFSSLETQKLRLRDSKSCGSGLLWLQATGTNSG